MADIKRKKERGATGGNFVKNKKFKSEASAAAANTSNSANKRALKRERQSHRKHADAVQEAKSVWNQIRLKGNSKAKRRELMDRLMPLITGRCYEIALQHDASRVVQAAIQFGTPEERLLILEEICDTQENETDNNLILLSKSQYAHFVVLKAIKYGHSNKACVKLLVKALQQQMPKLAVHTIASRIVESFFLKVSPKESFVLRRELYGPHFALFASEQNHHQANKKAPAVPTLESDLQGLTPNQKAATLEFVKTLLNKAMGKSLYGFSYVQELIADYVAVSPSDEVRKMAGSASEHAIHLLSTRSGTRAAAALVAAGTAKDRKRTMKSLKGYCKSGLLHHDAYLAILRLVQLTDDTVSINKNVFQELFKEQEEKTEAAESSSSSSPPLLDLALSDTGSKLFLMLLIKDEKERNKCFDPYELQVLSPNPVVLENGEEVPTSKKDAEIRRKELLQYLREPLISMCAGHSENLLRSTPGSLVLRHVYAAFYPEMQLAKAVVNVCQNSLDVPDGSEEENDGERKLPILEDRTGHLAVKSLLSVDASSEEESTPCFGSLFFTEFREQLFDVAKASNRGAFVVAALCKVPSIRGEVIGTLRPECKKIEKLSKENGGATSTAGLKALVKEISS